MEGPTNIIIIIINLKDPSKQEKEKEKSLPSLTQGYVSSQVIVATHPLTRKMRRI
jgi:hypothetical protein